MKSPLSLILLFLVSGQLQAQTHWVSIDEQYGNLPPSFHVYKSTDRIDGKPNVMYYAIADMGDKELQFTVDTSRGRRLTPDQYFRKDNNPLLIVNACFFSFATNENLNLVVKDGRVVSRDPGRLAAKGADSVKYIYPFVGTFGITRSGRPDIAWVHTTSGSQKVFASQKPVNYILTSDSSLKKRYLLKADGRKFSRWKVQTAVGGGPVLLQNGEVKITNNQERKFAGKAIDDRHPRTAIGYTKDNKIIVFVCEGRTETAAGLTLTDVANFMRELGCVEALNLDGGGSTTMLVNGKEVNTPSSKGVQRPVPSVFMIKKR
ncbi:MAG TPA: phosphodiester glycosidase family protein [Ginsengibacter sp.]|nr:phosphodiester glycosidase family protein [Ginsengibacter sp.]